MAMMHTSLVKYYESLFAFKQFHGWDISEIEALLPWEMDVMTSLITNHLETLELRRKQRETSRNSR
jgi:hypothetical protein